MKKKSRLTIDITEDEHTCIKKVCSQLRITMRELLLISAFEKILQDGDELDRKIAEQSLKKMGD